MKRKIKTADVLNKHWPEMVDVIICGSKTAKDDTANSEHLQVDIKKKHGN